MSILFSKYSVNIMKEFVFAKYLVRLYTCMHVRDSLLELKPIKNEYPTKRSLYDD